MGPRRPWGPIQDPRRRLPIGVAAIVVIFGAAVAAQITRPEYELKAAVVSKFPEFTEWPEDLLDNRRTIDLCVVRPNPFGQALSDLVAGEIVRGHALVVRDVSEPQIMTSCQVLFVPLRSSTHPEEVLASVKNLPVLTI